MKKSIIISSAIAGMGATAAIVAAVISSGAGTSNIPPGSTAAENPSAYVQQASTTQQTQNTQQTQTSQKPSTTKKETTKKNTTTQKTTVQDEAKKHISFNKKNTDPLSTVSGFDELEKKFSKVFEAIKKGYDSFSSKIDLSDYKISYSDLRNIVNSLGTDREYFYVSSKYEYSQKESENRVMEYLPKYTMSSADAAKYRKQINAEINRVYEEASKLKSDVEKLMYVHDYIIDNTVYNTSTTEDRNNIYGAFVLRNTLCTGYAEAFDAVASKLGFKSYIIKSDKINHAWNLVMLDGRYYHIDCAWDDPTITNPNLINNPVSDYGRYLNFLVSDSTAYKQDHASNDWSVNGYKANGAATSAYYDNFFWRDFNELMRYSNGNWYHSLESESAKNVSDVKFFIDKIHFTGNESYTIDGCRSINSCWKFGNSFYPVFYSTLQTYKGSVYYMKADGIYKLKDGGALNGSGDSLVFKNPRKDNIYDFDINASKGSFTVAYGKNNSNSSSNASIISYKISDYNF